MNKYQLSSEQSSEIIEFLHKYKNENNEQFQNDVKRFIDSTMIPMSEFENLSEILIYAPFEIAKRKFDDVMFSVNYENLPIESTEYLSKKLYSHYKDMLNSRVGLASANPVVLLYKMYKEYYNVYDKLRVNNYPLLNKFKKLGVILKKNSPLPLVMPNVFPLTISTKNMNINEVITTGKQIIIYHRDFIKNDDTVGTKLQHTNPVNLLLKHIRYLEECVLGCPVHPNGKTFN